ncbi:hypothetical protein PHYSODRAFT_303579 [Phytophthora sojae]|uniref:Uncharacterized protein n=1 Tax=Phytophthora sojae (strain P6497) TaxID=1094619 RepID=G4ZVX1_PHYSP|nr:hypothetical protein PHYSODRAFT_303579 [Phytophthora sojae]EGZ11551.1 hypothetical protein PHYSODRAFT_303579 [Phytophthora sojae]|eukprot:XP_009531884.1 hypothetical protein PHYSODRAFT_303579 [Phytophthora sojae]
MALNASACVEVRDTTSASTNSDTNSVFNSPPQQPTSQPASQNQVMRLYASRFRALVVLLLAISSHRAKASTCRTLLDSDSTLAQSLASWTETDLSPVDFATVFKEINTALPTLSMRSTRHSSAPPRSIEDIDEDLGTSEGWSNFCSVLEDTIMPCAKTVMTDIVMDALNSVDGCCDDFLNDVKTLFGDSLDDLAMKLGQLSVNVNCSERTFTNLNGVSKKEMCGYSTFKAFTFIESEESATYVLDNMLQIPNDEMCDAFAGKEFTTTNDITASIGIGTNDIDSMGICLQPIDSLLQHISSWEIFSETVDVNDTTVLLSDLFTSGKSISGDLLFDYATSESGLSRMGIRAADAVIYAMGGVRNEDDEVESSTIIEDWFVETLNSVNSYGEGLQVHIPNGGGCTYPDQSITLPRINHARQCAAAPTQHIMQELLAYLDEL